MFDKRGYLRTNATQRKSPKPRPITQKQRDFLEFAMRQVVDTGNFPTHRGFMAGLGIAHLKGVDNNLKALQKKGHIVPSEGRESTYRVVKDGDGKPVRLIFVHGLDA